MKVFNVDTDVTIGVDVIAPNESLTARQREHEAESKLLKSLLGDVTLQHNEAGKPILAGYNISISHTVNKHGGYVAIILSKVKEVGIDIEYISDRVMKIASRFLREDEHPATVEDNLVYWCAKEDVYKLFSADDLTYQQMRVNPSMSEVLNIKRNVTVPINKIINADYVLVWSAVNPIK